jgi:hypothetical protein
LNPRRRIRRVTGQETKSGEPGVSVMPDSQMDPDQAGAGFDEADTNPPIRAVPLAQRYEVVGVPRELHAWNDDS